MSYLSYLIYRRVEILQQLSSCKSPTIPNCFEGTVADTHEDLSRKAVLRMFRDDPNILDSKVSIGVFAVLLFMYVATQGFSILTMCGFFMEKIEEDDQNKHHYEHGEAVVVCIGDRYCKGMIHAQNENDTWHVIFSNRNVDELEAGIEASSSVAELVDLSKQITNVTSSEIEACDADVTALKTLLRKRLQTREVAAEHVQAISSLGMYNKIQMKFPTPVKLLNIFKKLYRTYRLSCEDTLSPSHICLQLFSWNKNAQHTELSIPCILVCSPQVPVDATI